MVQRNCKLALGDWGLALLVGALLVAPGLSAEGPRTGEEAILAALEEKTTVEFIDEPLSSVVSHFKQVHNVEIQVDVRALDDVKIPTDVPITKSLPNVTFRSALNLTLRDLDLTWMITDEVLMITTFEEAEVHLVTRVYDVAELVTVKDPEGKRWRDFNSLINAITSTIDPESWENVGGPGSIAELEFRGAAVLIVSQTHDVHSQLVQLLENLAEIGDRYGNDVLPTRKPEPPQSRGMGGFGGMEAYMGGSGSF